MFGTMHRVVGISPLQRSDIGLVVGVCRAGGLGVLDLGKDHELGLQAAREVARIIDKPFGLRVRGTLNADSAGIPASAEVVVLDPDADFAPWGERTILAQVVSLDEAREAVSKGAVGLIAKGTESGGRIGTETAFVLLQQFMAELDVPVWLRGGIGLHTAAAAIAGGASGVVLDAQLGLVRESGLAPSVRNLIRSMDGSETAVVGGYRFLVRPDLEITRDLDRSKDEVAALLGADDPTAQLVPCGQDASLASFFADRFLTAGRVVRAIDESIEEHLDQAFRLRPLAPGAPARPLSRPGFGAPAASGKTLPAAPPAS